jgi:hypothetical protein
MQVMATSAGAGQLPRQAADDLALRAGLIQHTPCAHPITTTGEPRADAPPTGDEPDELLRSLPGPGTPALARARHRRGHPRHRHRLAVSGRLPAATSRPATTRQPILTCPAIAETAKWARPRQRAHATARCPIAEVCQFAGPHAGAGKQLHDKPVAGGRTRRPRPFR